MMKLFSQSYDKYSVTIIMCTVCEFLWNTVLNKSLIKVRACSSAVQIEDTANKQTNIVNRKKSMTVNTGVP